MKAFKVIYQHGHFIDKESKLRIIPVQGEEYIITASPNAFTTEDTKLKMAEPLNNTEKSIWALQQFGKDNYGKILNSGEQLFFRVGNSRRVQGDESREYIFICTLLEDLYLHLLKGKKGDSAEDWRLADCKCILEKCLLGGLTLTEKIPAESLNKLFSKTVMFYFSMQRSASANVFNTFFRYDPKISITFDGIINKLYYSLGNERENFINKPK
jgi:hypothetical protein